MLGYRRMMTSILNVVIPYDQRCTYCSVVAICTYGVEEAVVDICPLEPGILLSVTPLIVIKGPLIAVKGIVCLAVSSLWTHQTHCLCILYLICSAILVVFPKVFCLEVTWHVCMPVIMKIISLLASIWFWYTSLVRDLDNSILFKPLWISIVGEQVS